jgi:secretion/DNA translocation related TadE-like protein
VTGRRADEGSATAWVLVVALALAAAAVALALLGSAVVARHRAAGAADAAALAAAVHVTETSAAACSVAGRVARANDADLRSCRVAADAVVVRVRLRPTGWLARFGATEGVARAGMISTYPANSPQTSSVVTLRGHRR